MCLEFEWFKEAETRREKRDKEGVSISEAVDCLSMYRSTAYPIGSEMAAWIYDNWTLKQVYELPSESREILFEIIEDYQNDDNGRESTAESTITDKKWVEWIVEAFENLGGTAYLESIYKEIERLRPDGLTPQWHATVRNVIESHSSDSYNYSSSRKDYFYSVSGIGGGHWGLRRLKENNNSFNLTGTENAPSS